MPRVSGEQDPLEHCVAIQESELKPHHLSIAHKGVPVGQRRHQHVGITVYLKSDSSTPHNQRILHFPGLHNGGNLVQAHVEALEQLRRPNRVLRQRLVNQSVQISALATEKNAAESAAASNCDTRTKPISGGKKDLHPRGSHSWDGPLA